MQDFDKHTEQMIGPAVRFLCVLGALGGKKAINYAQLQNLRVEMV